MLGLSLLIAAIAPGVALLSYFYLKDKYETEPIREVAKMFMLGVLVVLPIMIVQRGLVLAIGENAIVFSYGISAAVEEFVKWFLVFAIIYPNHAMDEPYDGIVYAVAASLGFATLENVLYATTQHATIGMLISRALLPVSAHALFGVVMGYYLGNAKFVPEHKKRFLAFSLFLPVVWHGTYNWILLSSDRWMYWLIVPFMFLLWLRGLHHLQRVYQIQYLHKRVNDPFNLHASGQ